MIKIKSISLLVTAFFSIALPVISQSNTQLLFDQANDALEAGDYQQALTVYNNLEDNNRISGALFLNMGISYVQLDSLGKAKYYFLKSSRFDETKEQARQGLEYVEQRFSRQSAVLPKLPWDKAVDWLKINVGSVTILGLAIILLNLGIITYVSTWFWTPFREPMQLSGLSSVGMGILLLLLSFYVQYVDNRYSEAVMVNRQTNVVEQPDIEAAVVSQAYEGYSFTVDEFQSSKHSGWSYVRMSNGLYGWIPDNQIMIL